MAGSADGESPLVTHSRAGDMHVAGNAWGKPETAAPPVGGSGHPECRVGGGGSAQSGVGQGEQRPRSAEAGSKLLSQSWRSTTWFVGVFSQFDENDSVVPLPLPLLSLSWARNAYLGLCVALLSLSSAS